MITTFPQGYPHIIHSRRNPAFFVGSFLYS
nr:MAG TPA: hypothetical protein [Caudoviricetes sp.]DAP19001.1 MAG TPA: hypothetical protein [Caudoviricetes sp.]